MCCCCRRRNCHAYSRLRLQRSLLTRIVWLLAIAAVAADPDQQNTQTIQPISAGPSVSHQKQQHPHTSTQQPAGDMRPSPAAVANAEASINLKSADYVCAVPDLSDVLTQPTQSTTERIFSSYPFAAPHRDHNGRGKHATDETPSIEDRTLNNSMNASVAEAGQGPEEMESVDHHNWAAAKAGGKILAANQEV